MVLTLSYIDSLKLCDSVQWPGLGSLFLRFTFNINTRLFGMRLNFVFKLSFDPSLLATIIKVWYMNGFQFESVTNCTRKMKKYFIK